MPPISSRKHIQRSGEIHIGAEPCNRLTIILIACIFTILSAQTIPAAEDTEAEAESVPVTLTESHFKELLESSPFTRTLNLSDNLALTGVAKIGGKPVLTLLNRTTQESHMVSDEPNADGWRILEIYPSNELGKVEAKVSTGGAKVVNVRFDESQLNPAEQKTKKPSAPPRPPGGGPPAQGNSGPPRRGPDPEMMKKYNSLSPEQQQRFREIMREQFTKNRNMSPEDRSKVIDRAFKSLKK